MLRVPPNADPYVKELVATLDAELLRREPLVIGSRSDSANSRRKRASTVSVASVWMPPSVVPDGSFNLGDRRTIAWSYYGGAADWFVRFRAPLVVGWVRVHVQSTVVGEGGVSAYDPLNFKSSIEVDCRQNRLQDVEVPALTGGRRYAMWLIPVQYDGAATAVLYDGEAGRPDNAAYVDLTT